MFWVGLLTGLIAGATLGAVIMCVVSMERVTAMDEALCHCRRVLADYAATDGEAMRACARVTKVLRENGWSTESDR